MQTHHLLALLAGISTAVAQSTTCPLQAKPTPPSNTRCGEHVIPSNQKYALPVVQATSATDCAQTCTNSGNCKSFAYNTKSEYCVQYKRGGNALSLTKAGKNTYFYNLNCFYNPAPHVPATFNLLSASDNPSFDQQYLYHSDDTSIHNAGLLTPNEIDADEFDLNSGYLAYDGGESLPGWVDADSGTQYQAIIFQYADRSAPNEQLLQCAIDGCTQNLACNNAPFSVCNGAGGSYSVGVFSTLLYDNSTLPAYETDPDYCYQVTFTAMFAGGT